MIDINVLLRAISPGGGVDRASSVIADAIKDSNKEKRREFVYEYQKIKKTYEEYVEQRELGEPVDEKAYEDCLKRFLIYKLAFKKLGVDVDSVS